MKVLVVSNRYPPDVQGGYELACAQAVEALRRRGHEVRVLCGAAPAEPQAHVARTLRVAPVFDGEQMAVHAPQVRDVLEAASLRADGANVAALVDEVLRHEPDVAYLWNLVGLGGLALVAALEQLGVPWAWHLEDAVPSTLCSVRGRPSAPLARAFGRLAVGRYLVCSSRLRAEVEAAGVALAGQVHLVPAWVDGPPVAGTPHHPGAPLRVAFAGQVAGHKGADLVLRAAAALGPGAVEVDLYGDVVDRSLPALAAELGLGAAVRFHGQVPHAELVRRLGSSHVVAFPTWSREPFGIAPIDGAHAGCLPVIADDCGVAEWLVHGVDCLKVPRSAEALADALRSVQRHEVDVEGIRRRAQAVVARDLHVDVVAAQVERVLVDAAASTRPARTDPRRVVELGFLAEELARHVAEVTG